MSHKEQFDRDGFVVLPGFFDPDQVATLREQLARYVRDVVPTLPPERAYFEDPKHPATLKRLRQLDLVDPHFKKLWRQPELTALATELLAATPQMGYVESVHLPPGSADPIPAHQDQAYYLRDYDLEPQETVAMWIALDASSSESGQLHHVPGSHLHGERRHVPCPVAGFSLTITDWDATQEDRLETLDAQPGDLIARHPLTIHFMNGNQTDRENHSIGLSYMSRLSFGVVVGP